ncbi:MAG: phenylalanine--tRNA ligase subunit alpha [Holosporaceae bacterium]|jgi:phenylalanyl-tRNA synthetase alpha chain|nr:phenylalanine--tRNA ligase subunit alpha [Holosporaceae bacterium]
MSELQNLEASSLTEIGDCDDLEKLERLRTVVFGKNGRFTKIVKKLCDLSEEQKSKFGSEINSVKKVIENKFSEKFVKLEAYELNKKLEAEFVDITMPALPELSGKIHPLTKVEEEVMDIFSSYGFTFADGPDIESEYFNFTALNVPDHHPARTMHDTFYVHKLADAEGRKLLRTHTSPVEIHTMLANKPPIRFFSIGRVYRSDYDVTHTPMFSQIEGIMIDENVGFADLKWVISDFLKKFFQLKDLQIRFRPSFFPFTEPSAEVDINYEIKGGKIFFGAGDKWMEVAGCGVLHPNVLKSGKVDSEKYRGIAFGFGLERLASLKYGIPDLRGYFESDIRWRETFGFSHFVR